MKKLKITWKTYGKGLVIYLAQITIGAVIGVSVSDPELALDIATIFDNLWLLTVSVLGWGFLYEYWKAK